MNKKAIIFSSLYFLLGILWIYLTNVSLILPFSAPVLNSLLTPSNLFAFIFLIITSTVIFVLISRNAKHAKANQQLYLKLFEDSPSPMWIYEEPSLHFLAVNKTAIQKYGYSREEFLQRKLEDIRPEETIPTLYKSIQGRNDEYYNEDGPFLHRKKNGEVFYVQINSRPTSYQGKKARIVVAVDINEKIIAEKRSKEAYKELSDYRLAISSATIVYATDLKGTINWVNDNFCQISQYPKQELLGKNIQELSNNTPLPSLLDEMFQALLKGDSWQGEIQQTGKNGSIYWLNVNAIPIFDKKGEIKRFISISTDITDKKQVQEELFQREKFLSSVVNSQSSFLIRISHEDSFTYGNERFLEEFTLKEKDLKTLNFKSTLLPNDIERFEQAKNVCWKDPGKIISVDLRLAKADNTFIWTSWEFVCLSDSIDCEKEIQGMGQDISQRKTAELALDKYAKRLEKVLDSINEAFYTIDRNWNFIKINKEFEQVYNVKRQDVLGENVWTVFPYAVGSSFYENLQKAMEEGIPLHFEEENTQEGKWFQVSVFPVKEGISCYSTDISKKKESENQLRQAIERYDTLTKATYDTTWEWDLITDYITWNEGIKAHFKYRDETIPHSPDSWEEKVHKEDFERVVQGLQQAIKKRQLQWEEEYRFLCGDGHYRYIVDRGYIIFDEQQNPIRMIGAIQDIHKQREYQEEIKKLSLVAEKTQNAVVITDQDGYIEWVNEGFTRLTGWKMEEVLNRKPREFLYGPSSDPYTIEKIDFNFLKKKKFSEELIYYKKNKEPFWVKVDVSPIFDKNGELIQFISIETDITERKKFEEMLKKQNEQLKEIAWISSHDIRRPVASILGLISLYDLEDPSKPFNQEIITLLNVSTNELDKVIRKIVFKTYEVDEMKEEINREKEAIKKKSVNLEGSDN